MKRTRGLVGAALFLMAGLLQGASSATAVPAAARATEAGPARILSESGREADKEICLRADSAGDRVLVDACGQGDPAQDLWNATPTEDGFYLLENVHRKNQGKPPCLRMGATTASVVFGNCHSNGTDGYDSKRRWGLTYTHKGTGQLRLSYTEQVRAGVCLAVTAQAQASNSDCASTPASRLNWTSSLWPGYPQRPFLGDTTALLLATHFTGEKPAAPDPVKKAVFGDSYPSLRDYLRTVSGGRVRLAGDFLQDIDLGPRPAVCPDAGQVVERARSAARNAGYRPEAYDRILVDMSASKCDWAGMGQMPGNWIVTNGSGWKTWAWTHELGHNLGFQHSHALKGCAASDNVVTIGAQCKDVIFNEPTDTMGGGGMNPYPANYRQYAGWLGPDQVQEIDADGTYRLGALGDASSPQELRIPRGDGTYLSVEYRQRLSPYDSFTDDSPFFHGVVVRIISVKGTVTNTLIDTRPETDSSSDAALTVGRTLRDEQAHVAVRLAALDPSGAQVAVESSRRS